MNKMTRRIAVLLFASLAAGTPALAETPDSPAPAKIAGAISKNLCSMA